MFSLTAYTRQIIMLGVPVGVEVKTDQNDYNLGIGHNASTLLECTRRESKSFFALSSSNSLQKSSAIQKNSVTSLSVIMMKYLLFGTIKLLIINDITKRIGNFFKLPIHFFAVLIPKSRYKAVRPNP